MSQLNLDALCIACIALAKEAGETILSVAASADLQIKQKADKTPVTIADEAADQLITAGLSQLTPEVPIISEEGKDIPATSRLSWPQCWLVDPLDGTRGFIDGSGQYTVNIALIDNHQPVLGVIYAPQLDLLYYAYEGRAWRVDADGETQIKCGEKNTRETRIAVSQYHGSSWLDKLNEVLDRVDLVRMNSSIKLCYVADGTADIYPRLGPTSEWDTAAGQCIIEAAGGCLVDLAEQTLQYNARDTLINPGFLALGDSSKKAYFLELIQSVRSES